MYFRGQKVKLGTNQSSRKETTSRKNLPCPYLGKRVQCIWVSLPNLGKKISFGLASQRSNSFKQYFWEYNFTLSFWCQSLASNCLKNSQPACLQIISWLQRDQVCNLLVREPYSNIGYSCDGPKFLFRVGFT